jgi:hypothetical protein
MASKKVPNVRIILNESYIKTIKNSLGSNLFRNLYAHIDGKKIDILRNGNLSCANFVSTILHRFKLIKDIHATVEGTIKDLERSGWQKIKKPKPGAILIWEARKFGSNNTHKHIGFYIGKNKAISTSSNSSKKGQPTLHHWTFGIYPIKSGKAGTAKRSFDRAKNGQPARKVEQIFWNKKLELTLKNQNTHS